MQLISGAVGNGGANNVSDVALVQAILVKIVRPAATGRAAGPYLASYDGAAGQGTTDAITAFQTDNGLLPANGAAPAANARTTAGQVAPNDATWTKLLEKVPADFADMRVLAGAKTVYLAATDAVKQARLTAAGNLTFTSAFLLKVQATINKMYADHGIAVGVCPQGDRRTFQEQYALRTSGRGVTNAGPGESNHNFGGAADMGFKGLRWLRANGTVCENEGWWLAELDKVGGGQSDKFWAALRTAGTSIGAFRGPIGDKPHLQNWNDAGVSMAASLAALLTASGTMRWTGRRGAYSCDLGLGGALIPVGNAVQIWSRQATITAADIQRLREAAAARPGARAGAAVPPRAAQRNGPAVAAGRPNVAGPTTTPPGGAAVTPAEVAAMKQALRGEFDRADANWRAWTAR